MCFRHRWGGGGGGGGVLLLSPLTRVHFRVDLVLYCSISDFAVSDAHQLDESRSIFTELRPEFHLYHNEIFQTHLLFDI